MCIKFIHSFRPFLKHPFKSSTTQRLSRLQHGYCIGVSRRSAQATASKGLAQGPYMAARAGVEPTTLRLKVIVSTNAPPRLGLSLKIKVHSKLKSNFCTNSYPDLSKHSLSRSRPQQPPLTQWNKGYQTF